VRVAPSGKFMPFATLFVVRCSRTYAIVLLNPGISGKILF
jgi:hypothetical protein